MSVGNREKVSVIKIKYVVLYDGLNFFSRLQLVCEHDIVL